MRQEKGQEKGTLLIIVYRIRQLACRRGVDFISEETFRFPVKNECNQWIGDCIWRIGNGERVIGDWEWGKSDWNGGKTIDFEALATVLSGLRGDIFQVLAVGDYIGVPVGVGFGLVGFGLYLDPADGDFLIVAGR